MNVTVERDQDARDCPLHFARGATALPGHLLVTEPIHTNREEDLAITARQPRKGRLDALERFRPPHSWVCSSGA